LIDLGSSADAVFEKDSDSNQLSYTINIIEGDQPLDSFVANEPVLWSLESGSSNQTSLFKLIENVDNSVSVNFKDNSNPGIYRVNLCSSDPSGNKTCLTILIKVRAKVIIVNLLNADNQEQELIKDPKTNLSTVEKVISEGEQKVADFTSANDLVWVLERFGNKDDVLLFDLIYNADDESIDPSGKVLFQKRTTNSSAKKVSVVFKDKSIAGVYQVKLVAKDLFGNESFVVIKVTVLANVLDIISLQNELIIEWGSSTAIKSIQQILTSDGETPFFDALYDETSLNRFLRGDYKLEGELLLPYYLKNSSNIKASLIVRVLPKSAPVDLKLSKNVFEADLEKDFLFVGNFEVVDPVDDIHEVELYNDGYDNKFFEIKDKILFWSSADPGAGKTKFTILVRVTDRDGNTLDKFFEISRTRPSVSSIVIRNVFSPNGDGFNDKWGVPGIRFYRGARLQVFDGGGILMFYTEDTKILWDGTHKEKDLPIGSYYWIIEVEETGETRRGIVNLLRR
jgi:gliding motility-associated-like protein